MPKETEKGKKVTGTNIRGKAECNPFFRFTTLLGTKEQLDRFCFFLEDMTTARKYCCVVWP